MPTIRLKVTKESGEVESITFKKKRRIYSLYTHDKISEWDLKVTYCPGYWNHGTYDTREEMLRFFKQATEKQLIDYLEETEDE